MVRTVGSSRDKTWALIRSTGVELLFEHGYEAMNTRQLAAAVGLKPGSLYYYFDSKEEFLHLVVSDLLTEILDDLGARLADVTDPVERLRVYVSTLIRWHVDRHKETFIARMEVRSLSDDKRATYLEQRDQFDTILDGILESGHEAGVFVPDPKHLMRISILTMITGVSSWYREGGLAGRDEIVEFYRSLIEHMVGAPRA